MGKFNELVDKLREIFQIDRPDLDFGIYRILNSRADEINEYLEKRLKEKVEEALASGNGANVEQLKEDLKKAEQGAHDLGVSPDTVPKVQELKKKIAETSGGAAEHENTVFSHLLTFFSRYYDQGDFISQRRYKGDTYAIPYAGEEVMLHWANKDQYYIKSGENFLNYTFKLDDGRLVHFRLITADTAKDNRKDNDKERRFVLAEQKVVSRIDEEGDEYEDEILPVEEIDKKGEDGCDTKELVIRFEYKAMPKGTKQDKLVEAAVAGVLNHVTAEWLGLANLDPTEKNPKRSLLEKHLNNYTTKNTADYFIHKNLGRFLKAELDFYIKNEVIYLDDIQNAEALSDIEKNLRMIQCLRSIALDLIAFLAQLEDFQKKLWTKKKFVVSCDYCITINRISEKLYEDIVDCYAQWRCWVGLGVIDEDSPRTVDFLKKNQYLLLDTSFFKSKVKNRILSEIDDIDGNLSGTIINSDNYHAVNLLQEKESHSFDCIYIDPPYNTDATPIIYKNGFKSSSWLSLIESRLSLSCSLLKENSGYFSIAIDDNELTNLSSLLQSEYPQFDLHKSIVNHYPGSGTGRSNISRTHEYNLFLVPSDVDLLRGGEKEAGVRERGFCRSGQGDNNFRRGRPNSFYAVVVDELTKEIIRLEAPPQGDYPIGKTKDGHKRIYPLGQDGSERCWTLSYETAKSHIDGNTGILFCTPNLVIKRRYYDESSRSLLPSVWVDNKYSAVTNGTNLLTEFFGEGGVFSYPKSIYTVMSAIEAGTHLTKDPRVLDYFSGSGTTAHAAIALSRKTGRKHYFTLVEQGEYFENVTKSRVLKALYSTEWTNGRPKEISNESHIVKLLRLESYEDALNNLELKRTEKQQSLLSSDKKVKETYQVNYMLDVESQGSLLSVDDFKRPFEYIMRIADNSSGASDEHKIDLVETFNYLIGLTIKHIDAQPQRGFVTVTGILPSGESCLVLWRDCEVLGYEGVAKLCNTLAINPADNEFDVVYINGDHNIPTVLTQTAEEGGETRVLKLRQIEPEFLERMFSSEDM